MWYCEKLLPTYLTTPTLTHSRSLHCAVAASAPYFVRIEWEIVKKVISEVDVNGDGEINFEEFKNLMKKNVQ